MELFILVDMHCHSRSNFRQRFSVNMHKLKLVYETTVLLLLTQLSSSRLVTTGFDMAFCSIV